MEFKCGKEEEIECRTLEYFDLWEPKKKQFRSEYHAHSME